jgi:molybdate transport system regulatory protein
LIRWKSLYPNKYNEVRLARQSGRLSSHDLRVRYLKPMACIAVRFRVDFNAAGSIGPGKIALLEAIARSGSLSQAARDLRMSYRRAWVLVDSLNGMFSRTVASSTTGGRGGGGMRLTPFGESVIKSYRKLEREVEKQAAVRLRSLAHEVAAGAEKKPLPRRAVSRTRGLK